MSRRFDHDFTPASADPIGDVAQLTTLEIANAGLREVLQAPGAALGSWALLDALLDPDTEDFRFLEPLGRSREVKTALSGLFGRFVARAYAERHLRIPYFAHITDETMAVDPVTNARIRRLAPGDLPDWVTWRADTQALAIVEAKGSHEPGQPKRALKRAKDQAERVTVEIDGVEAPLKRFAIATRWASSPLERSMICVDDPDAPGGLSGEDVTRIGLGVARAHAASLLAPLGHHALAKALRSGHLETGKGADLADGSARAMLERSSFFRVDAPLGGLQPEGQPATDLIGGYVIRGGVVPNPAILDRDDIERLRRMDLDPVLVGIDRQTLDSLITGDREKLAVRQVWDVVSAWREDPLAPQSGGGGDWVVRSPEIEVEVVAGQTVREI
jgi:hypothetical protein